MGFICQLLDWHKRRHGTWFASTLYRPAPHCSRDHTVVCKIVDKVDVTSLDTRGYALHRRRQGTWFTSTLYRVDKVEVTSIDTRGYTKTQKIFTTHKILNKKSNKTDKHIMVVFVIIIV